MTTPKDPLGYEAQLRQHRLIWPVSIWPVDGRDTWILARLGTGPAGRDNPAAGWSKRTAEKCEDGYGGYLSWLHRKGLLIEGDTVVEKITRDWVIAYTATLKARVSPVSVGMMLGSLTAAAKALAPDADWSWPSRRATRLKTKATPCRDKPHAMQHTLELYRFGKSMMETADRGRSSFRAAQRYQAGLIIALLAARPLRIRNFQAISIGTSLRWDGQHYWLTFEPEDTKTGETIDEPLPDDLVPYLEVFLRDRRPLLVRQATKFMREPAHRRLWVNTFGAPMEEAALRELIKTHTRRQFGNAVWP
jgi:hypothetical protein